ncbi:MAG: VOC family protein [FCB group bacterium]|nr:VOC family protein [FCB group bacterium]
MLNHIGITVKDISEVKNFYQDILGMEILKQFTINSELSNQIFQINEETEVFLMQKDNLILELFIHENTVPKQYNHICVDVHSRNDLIEKTKKYNYTCKIIPRKNFNLVFIKDKLGNNFEVKEI